MYLNWYILSTFSYEKIWRGIADTGLSEGSLDVSQKCDFVAETIKIE